MNELEHVKTPDYFNWIGELKRRYRATQIKAAVAVNSALIEFYWHLGKDISERYPGRRRNVHFFDELSADLKTAIPESNGLSSRNLRYICAFYEFYESLACVQQVVANNAPVVSASRLDALLRIPWGHHVLILDKCKDDCEKALFYVRKTVENGWSRSVLALEISQDLYARQGKSVTNFALTMPKLDSDLAQQLTKDPYIFDVQGLTETFRETELTHAMCDNIVRLLGAMGRGFAFVGREYVVEMGEREYRIDLLFYVIPLHRYFVVEVKTDAFKPEYLGQLQGYVAACDLKLNTPQDNPAIGLLVCRGKDAPLAKYLLGKIDMPLGVSDYELMREVPPDFKSQLPSIAEIEAELANMEAEE